MLKNKIYKYFTIEIIKTFFTILFALSAIAWTVRAVSFLDLVVENGHSIITYLLFSFLNVTNIITKFIPLSFLLALILTILKFEKQNELVILWTTGLNKIKLANLFFLVSLIVLIIQLAFAVYITPNSLYKSRSLIRTSNFDSMSTIIKINDFSSSFKDLTFYVAKKNSNGEMENIFIRDESNTFKNLLSSSEEPKNTTIIARKGIINNKQLILIDGLIQVQNSQGKIDNLNFKKTDFAIDLLRPKTIIKPKLQETFTSSLINCLSMSQNQIERKKIVNCPKTNIDKDIISTLLRRIGMPIYIPLISLICSFLLISNKEKKFNYLNKYIYGALGFFILVLAEILVRYSGFSQMHSLFYLLSPLILIPLVYLVLIRKLGMENK
tara:strand:+ start:372 stop:1517 length:1146 start_codon:yes stop_codon:yes gene_type:complete